jgi:hypothetical protein
MLHPIYFRNMPTGTVTERRAAFRGWTDVALMARNFLATLIEHEGFVPNSRGYVPVPIRTAADEIEQAVMEMERKGFFKPGRVMRCEYFMLRAPFESKMQNMRSIGLPMSRAGYYLYLGQAKAFIAGALTQRAVA